MKMIKSILALAATLAVSAGVAQAVMPVTFSLTAYVKPGSIIQPITVNNASILQHVGTALHVSTAGLKLCVNEFGDLILADAAGVEVYDLSAGEFTSYNQSITIGVNGYVITNYTQGHAYVNGNFGDEFGFWDPIAKGTFTDANLFDVKAVAIAGRFQIVIGWDSYSHNNDLNNTIHTGHSSESIEISDGARATGGCKLAAGVYTQSFNIAASGFYASSQFGDNGILFGTVSASGSQTGGTSFLDPFNGYGNYDTDFSF